MQQPVYLEFKSCLTGRLGQGFNPAVILVSTPVEHYLLYPQAQGSFSHHGANNLGLSRLGFTV